MHKYYAKQTTLDGHKFDSIAESRRYAELKLLQQTGTISELIVHPVFCLQAGFLDNTGKRQRAINYEADFSYWENGKIIVEDVKGFETQAWLIKKKIFMYQHPGIQLRVIK